MTDDHNLDDIEHATFPDLPADNRDAIQQAEDEWGQEFAEVVASNIAARLERRWDDVDDDRERFLTRMFLPPRPPAA